MDLSVNTDRRCFCINYISCSVSFSLFTASALLFVSAFVTRR